MAKIHRHFHSTFTKKGNFKNLEMGESGSMFLQERWWGLQEEEYEDGGEEEGKMCFMVSSWMDFSFSSSSNNQQPNQDTEHKKLLLLPPLPFRPHKKYGGAWRGITKDPAMHKEGGGKECSRRMEEVA